VTDSRYRAPRLFVLVTTVLVTVALAALAVTLWV